jgi:hypothetical protein
MSKFETALNEAYDTISRQEYEKLMSRTPTDYHAASDASDHFAHGALAGRRYLRDGVMPENPHKGGNKKAADLWSAGFDSVVNKD